MIATPTKNHVSRQVPYQPIGAALDLFYYEGPEVLIEGPAGTGKSRAVLEKVHLLLMAHPGSRGLIVRKTRASMTESVLVTFESKVLPENSPLLKSGGQRRQRQAYVYPNGSHLVVGGMDNALRIMSTEYDVIAVFEGTELTEAEWEMLGTRLRNNVMPFQQAIIDCNPDAPSHWLNQRANKPGLMQRLRSRHHDNPSVTPAYLARLDALTGARKKRLKDGIWAAAEGMVFDNWDPDKHLIDADKVLTGMVRWTVVGVDWGYRDPGVMQVWGVLGDNRMVRLVEHYHTAKTIPEWWVPRGLELKRMYSPRAFVCDPSQPANIEVLRRAGLPAIEAVNDIRIGLDRVHDRLDMQPDGSYGIQFVRDGLLTLDQELAETKQPKQTIEEFESYVYAKPVKEQRNLKEDPVDFSNHGMDAMRYAVMYVDPQKGRISGKKSVFHGGD